jgi:SAM-dependent methyltransferase
MSGKKHWTKAMFVERSELFLPFLEERLGETGREVGAIKQVLDSRGVPKNAKVLDVCCGIGRHSVELARLGYDVVGIDVTPRYIEYAKDLAKKRKVSKRTKFIIGDSREIPELTKGHGKFDAIISMFTSFGYYGENVDRELFRDTAKVSKKGAVFFIDTINRDWLAKNYENNGISSAKDIEVHEFRKFDFRSSFVDNVWKYYRMRGDERQHLATLELSLRVYSPHELIKMLQDSGWKRVDAYDDVGLNALHFNTLTSRLVVVARK